MYNSEFKPCALNGRTGGRRSRNVSTEVTTRRKPGGVYQPRPRNLRFHVQPRQNLTEKLHVLFLAAALQCGARGVPAYQDGKSDLHSQRRRQAKPQGIVRTGARLLQFHAGRARPCVYECQP